MNQWLSSGAAQPMAGKAAKACQNGWGLWLHNAGICQGSSDFFSFSVDYKIFALRDSKPSPLNEPSQQIQTSLCSADSPLLSSPQCLQQLVHEFPAAIWWLSLLRTPLQKSKFIWRCCKCRPVFVTRTGLLCSPLTNTASETALTGTECHHCGDMSL